MGPVVFFFFCIFFINFLRMVFVSFFVVVWGDSGMGGIVPINSLEALQIAYILRGTYVVIIFFK
jgi:hypothetical protein